MSIYGIVGGRDFNDYIKMREYLDTLSITRIISGGARGADKLAEKYSKERSIPIDVILPDWSLGKKAGPMRNIKIVQQSQCIVAFWDGKSPGTQSTINIATSMSKPVTIISY